MAVDEEIIDELIDVLQMLIEEEDLSGKIRTSLEEVLLEVTPELTEEELLKIQDELENISNMNNINDFCRTELMNIITSIESAINS